MIIWSEQSLVQYIDALAAVDAILTLIVDLPSIIYDKEIAWDALLKIICVLFEYFPSILDSNGENVTTIVCIHYSIRSFITNASLSFI
jgi:hypothetical protein